MTGDEILALFRQSHALLEGHFELTSGLHSPHYVQCAKVLQYPVSAEKLCREISEHFRAERIEVVIAPALGGIVVAQEVGRQLNARTIFAERSDGSMQIRRGFEISAGERVLICEDVITTGGSVGEVMDIVTRRGGRVIGVAAIVDRSGGKVNLPGFFAAVTMNVVAYRPGECPLCNEGIPIEKPGSRRNQ